MTYSEIAVQAKDMARDILRAQMAGRIQGRLTNAKETLLSVIRDLAHAKARYAREDASPISRGLDSNYFATEREAIHGLDVDEATKRELIAEVDEAERKEEERVKEDAKYREESRTRELESLQKSVDSAAEEVAKFEGWMSELDAGNPNDNPKLRISLDEMKALADKLIEEGRVGD